MTEPRLCEYIKHWLVGGFGWVSQYDAMVKKRAGQEGYAYLSGWYAGMLDELLAELEERELEQICQRLQRRQENVDRMLQKDVDDGR